MIRLLRVLTGTALVALLLHPTPASAHATLVSSSPEQGERLSAAPAAVSFEFSEPMSSPAYVVVTPPDGTEVLVGEPVVDGTTVRQEIRPDGPEGTWTTAVRAVSEDGHPVTAQITFQVGAGDLEAPTTGDETDRPVAEQSTSADRSASFSWTRRHTDVAVGGGLFLLAGLLLLLARRSPR